MSEAEPSPAAPAVSTPLLGAVLTRVMSGIAASAQRRRSSAASPATVAVYATPEVLLTMEEPPPMCLVSPVRAPADPSPAALHSPHVTPRSEQRRKSMHMRRIPEAAPAPDPQTETQPVDIPCTAALAPEEECVGEPLAADAGCGADLAPEADVIPETLPLLPAICISAPPSPEAAPAAEAPRRSTRRAAAAAPPTTTARSRRQAVTEAQAADGAISPKKNAVAERKKAQKDGPAAFGTAVEAEQPLRRSARIRK
jgi:hypothetical protein